MARWPDRETAIRYDRVLEVFVDRVEARFGAWYEMFPRSQGKIPGKSATFADCEERLPEIKAMGFDVVYLVPIHPIGRVHRKGPNNTLTPGPDDPGSPYAIGSVEGGHKAVHPEPGTLADFRCFVRACHAQGMEAALDFAIQCAPTTRGSRSIPIGSSSGPTAPSSTPRTRRRSTRTSSTSTSTEGTRKSCGASCSRLSCSGSSRVKIFRVDNPYTKPVPFWEWVIREICARDPEVIFLSEAFTRPTMLQMLAKVGFSQSYTYFTQGNFARADGIPDRADADAG